MVGLWVCGWWSQGEGAKRVRLASAVVVMCFFARVEVEFGLVLLTSGGGVVAVGSGVGDVDQWCWFLSWCS